MNSPSSPDPLRCGIDVGSTTAKVVVLDPEGRVVFHDYRRHEAQVRATLRGMLGEAGDLLGAARLVVRVTGSAGMGISERLDLPFIQEVVAATEAARLAFPGVRALVDIGGEDSKLVLIDSQGRADIRMNGSCAGGTGAFIDQVAALLDCPVEDFDALAARHDTTPCIASRCGVFARTDVQTLLAQGVPRADIAAAVYRAVAQQVLTTLARGAELRPKLLLAGGPLSFMPGLRQAVREAFGVLAEDVVLPAHPELVPALGAALSAGPGAVDSGQGLTSVDGLLGRLAHDALWGTEGGQREPALFGNDAEREAWLSTRFSPADRVPLAQLHGQPAFLGIDSGSTSTKMALVDEQGRLAFEYYTYSKGDHVGAVVRGLQKLVTELERLGAAPRIVGSAATGYGEDLVRAVFGLDHGVVETLAHLHGARHFEPRVQFVLDIGGQDMKATFVEDGAVARIEINEACSSGCGAFLQSFAEVLGEAVEDFAVRATHGRAPCALGSRCTVFMNSKVKQYLREGAAVEDIAAGLSYSVVRNCLHKVLKLRAAADLGEHIVVQGGAFLNPSIQRAFEKLVGRPVTCPDVAGLTGALGAALEARDRWQAQDSEHEALDLTVLCEPGLPERKQLSCRGCTNHCAVTRLRYGTGKPCYSGNRCERIFASGGERREPGVDGVAEQRALLEALPRLPEGEVRLVVGLPMALNMWDDLPFWATLLTGCGLEVRTSRPSSPGLLAQGAGTVMSDSICFPAKLAHGHVLDLVDQGVDRVLYPRVVYGAAEYEADNSFNCPIVTGYPDVIRSSVDPEARGTPMDSPTISFRDPVLLRASCWRYLRDLGVPRGQFQAAFAAAKQAGSQHRAALQRRAGEVVREASAHGRAVVLLAGRPYHLDALVNHGVPDMLAAIGVDVLFGDAAPDAGGLVEVRALTQWAFPNRLYNAARWAGEHPHVHLLQLNSFGCGPDSIVTDELRALMGARGEALTVLRVDEVSSPGSLRLRLRTLVETQLSRRPAAATRPRTAPPEFVDVDRARTVLVPCMHGGLTPFIEAEFGAQGYRVEVLPPADATSRELGLRYVNNEICYPAILVIGDLIQALQSGRYRRDEVAVGITQTGGQCRASNYLGLLEKALVAAGFEDVPVVSMLPAGSHLHCQSGFQPDTAALLKNGFYGLVFDDVVTMMEHSLRVRELVPGTAARLAATHRRGFLGTPAPSRRSTLAALDRLARDFSLAPARELHAPRVGIVGEIYAKYGTYANHGVVDWLGNQGVEVVMAQLSTFFTQDLLNPQLDVGEGVRRRDLGWLLRRPLMGVADRFVAAVNRRLTDHPHARPLHTPGELAAMAAPVLSLVNQYGEGWLIAAEVRAMSELRVSDVLCLQPFGCIANQVVAKGVERRLHELHPELRLLFLDLDPDAAPANLLNRLHFLVQGARTSAATHPGPRASTCSPLRVS
jgi:predicted CoA-substrate-specific enzyme activase